MREVNICNVAERIEPERLADPASEGIPPLGCICIGAMRRVIFIYIGKRSIQLGYGLDTIRKIDSEAEAFSGECGQGPRETEVLIPTECCL